MLTAKDIMTTKVITAPSELSVENLALLLWENKIGGAPVLDSDGNLIGVVTESDLIDQAKNLHIPTVVSILDSFVFLESTEKMDKEIEKMTGRVVGDICAKELVTVTEDTTFNEIATIMSEKKIHTLPVTANGKMVGVIGKSDLIRAISQGE
nr:CBS domain-containing protein [Desulfobulbaceae bacterium]